MVAKLFRTVLGILALILALTLAPMPSMMPLAHAQDAASLKSRHAQLRPRLIHNAFNRPLNLESSGDKRVMKGEVYAEIDRPFLIVAQALQGTDHWCDILILHLNVKGCRAYVEGNNTSLHMHIGRKFDQPLADTYAFVFLYNPVTIQSDYFNVALTSATGPLGTSDYRVIVEAVQLDARRSFMHLSYTYKYGMIANVAMRSYLATGGRHKVGFSTAGRTPDGQPIYLGGLRGVIERNTMRYYLAIDSYLGAPHDSVQQLDQRLNDWHTGVEQYSLQLHEMERPAYLAMKHKEVTRQQAPIATLATAH